MFNDSAGGASSICPSHGPSNTERTRSKGVDARVSRPRRKSTRGLNSKLEELNLVKAIDNYSKSGRGETVNPPCKEREPKILARNPA